MVVFLVLVYHLLAILLVFISVTGIGGIDKVGVVYGQRLAIVTGLVTILEYSLPA